MAVGLIMILPDRARVVFLAIALPALLATSCGPSPTSPGGTPTASQFTAGNYTLQLSTPGTPPPGSANLSAFLCVGDPGAVTSSSVDVIVEIQGGQVIGRSTTGSLVLTLQTNGVVVGGALSGQARNLSTGVVVSAQPGQGEASVGLSGRVLSDRAMGGYVDGFVHYSAAGGGYGCSSSDWSLAPR